MRRFRNVLSSNENIYTRKESLYIETGASTKGENTRDL